VRLQQKTDYPSSGRVAITVEPSRPAEFPLRLRIPRWCQSAAISINGESVAGQVKLGDWHVLKRSWKTGDVATLDMPMPIRLVQGRKLQAGKVAVMRGPLVFCLPSRRPDHSSLDVGIYGTSAELQRATAESLKRQIKLDLASIAGPVSDNTVRPEGLALQVRAWGPESDRSKPADLAVLLTEVVDPSGEQTYFSIDAPKTGVEDELMFLPSAQ
jgi:uncharacterized protein